MIADVLPRYNQALESVGDNPERIEILRSIVINGHECAWVERTYTYLVKPGDFTTRSFTCECEYTEHVGWRLYEFDGSTIVSSLDRANSDRCLFLKTAQFLIQRELKREYIKRYEGGPDFTDGTFIPHARLQDVFLDLMDRVKQGETIGELGNGAAFWGGFFYAQTFTYVTNISFKTLWDDVIDPLVLAKKIRLNGMVVCAYTEPPKPKWTRQFVVEREGVRVTAYLPAHDRMRRDWKFVVKPTDSKRGKPHYLPLTYSTDFGIDISDIAEAEAKVNELIAATQKPS